MAKGCEMDHSVLHAARLSSANQFSVALQQERRVDARSTMFGFDSWLRRLRREPEKVRERVLTSEKVEFLTSTQACRFKELQHLHSAGKKAAAKASPHCSLAEAARDLNLSTDELLLSAAAGDIECSLPGEALRGDWHLSARASSEPAPALPGKMPPYLALKPEDCRDIAAYGSVNILELYYPALPGDTDRKCATRPCFRLTEPLWIDPDRIVLTHPLPQLNDIRLAPLPLAPLQSGNA